MHGRLVLRNTILEREGSDPVPERGHVGALLEPSGWPIYPASMCRFHEQSNINPTAQNNNSGRITTISGGARYRHLWCS
jgi:hypothetical protein